MTASERLATWAANDREIFVGVSSGDNPYEVQRVKARAVLIVGLARLVESNSARAEAIRGVDCVVVEMAMPHAPDSTCRVVLSPVELFA
jgi:hypothetical protein